MLFFCGVVQAFCTTNLYTSHRWRLRQGKLLRRHSSLSGKFCGLNHLNLLTHIGESTRTAVGIWQVLRLVCLFSFGTLIPCNAFGECRPMPVIGLMLSRISQKSVTQGSRAPTISGDLSWLPKCCCMLQILRQVGYLGGVRWTVCYFALVKLIRMFAVLFCTASTTVIAALKLRDTTDKRT